MEPNLTESSSFGVAKARINGVREVRRLSVRKRAASPFGETAWEATESLQLRVLSRGSNLRHSATFMNGVEAWERLGFMRETESTVEIIISACAPNKR